MLWKRTKREKNKAPLKDFQEMQAEGNKQDIAEL